MQASLALPQTQMSIDRDQIAAIERLIRPYLRHTPIVTVAAIAANTAIGANPMM